MMSSLYIGATGMKTQAEGMGVVTNNLANVNTVAYKRVSMEFADLVSSYVCNDSSATNLSQKGMGAAVGSTRTLFNQGGFESSNSFSDVSISGIGFFGVQSGNTINYTRAGNLTLTKEGTLVDSSGWTILGRKIVNGQESASVTPLELDFSKSGIGSMEGRASSQLTTFTRLGGLQDMAGSQTDPCFALAQSWNGTAGVPLSPSGYGYSTPVQFYDSNGELRNGTIYYDSAGTTNGMRAVEYVLGIDPSQDGSSLSGTRAAGLLMAGTMTFSSAGEMVNMTAFAPPSSGDPADLSGWSAAATENGLPAFSVTPKGAEVQSVGLNLGLGFPNGMNAGLSSAADLSSNASAVYSVDVAATRGASTSTFYGDNPATISSLSDGYGYGELSGMDILSDGTINARYSNGQNVDVARISLYRFTSQDGLRHEGSNHYSATAESGAAQEGRAGDENFGTIRSYGLEQSNVDYAREFTNMIISQRGFQMNSKVITTSDTMLQRALEIKR